MAEITALFFDVGGVLGTNGWDRTSRRAATERFGLDWEDYRDRHDHVARDLETGRITLDVYLDRTVFYRDRPFTRGEFAEFIYAQSEPNPDVLEYVGELAGSGTYLLGTINNESRELNELRIERFGLRPYFTLFVTSSYVGVSKPDPAIYRLALDLTHRVGEECVFIDDREINLECAALEGMHPVHFRDYEQLREELERLGVSP
jgi:putative hydrolase of the HAD superfamily